MKVKIVMEVGEHQLSKVVEIDDNKLEPLTEEEVQAAVEIKIREWADNQIRIAWEVIESDDTNNS